MKRWMDIKESGKNEEDEESEREVINAGVSKHGVTHEVVICRVRLELLKNARVDVTAPTARSVGGGVGVDDGGEGGGRGAVADEGNATLEGHPHHHHLIGASVDKGRERRE